MTVRTRAVRPIVLLVVAAVLSFGALVTHAAQPVGASGMSSEAHEFLRRLNQERVGAGLAPLVHGSRLADTSRTWSRTMSNLNVLMHDPALRSITDRVEPAWRSFGENVGRGGSVGSLHDAFMASPGHRANVLNSGFNRVGIGTVQSGRTLWVTLRFLRGPAISGPTGLSSPSVCTGGTKGVVFSADLNGSGRDEIVINRPGTHCDAVLTRTSGSTFGAQSIRIGGDYIPVVGDFNGDGRDNVLWYGGGGGAPSYLSRWNGSSFVSIPMTINGRYRPYVGDFDGDGRDDILWYGPGAAPDYIWYGTSTFGRFDSRPLTVNGHYEVVVTDLDGDGRDDILWYGPGPAPDYVHYSMGRGRHISVPVTINGYYQPIAGDFDGDGRGDVLWYAPGPAPDYIWYGHGRRGAYDSRPLTINGRYTPVSGDFNGSGRTDIAWVSGDPNGSPIWFGGSSRGSFGRAWIQVR